MKKPKPATRIDVVQRFRELCEKHGKNHKAVADDLNRARIRTPLGKEWSPNNVRSFINRHPQVVPAPAPAKAKAVPKRTAPAASKRVPPPPPRAVEVTKPPAPPAPSVEELLESYQSGVLRNIIQWYEATRGEIVTVAVPQTRPTFKKPKRNTGVLVSEPVIQAALKMMNTEKAKVGRTLSALIEYLLWTYAGSPSGLIEDAEAPSRK